MTWIDLLRDYLCKLYKTWGGDCAQLGMIPDPAIPTLVALFSEQGLPLLDADEAKELEATLDEIESHLKDNENELSQLYTDMLNQLISDIRAAMGEA